MPSQHWTFEDQLHRAWADRAGGAQPSCAPGTSGGVLAAGALHHSLLHSSRPLRLPYHPTTAASPTVRTSTSLHSSTKTVFSIAPTSMYKARA